MRLSLSTLSTLGLLAMGTEATPVERATRSLNLGFDDSPYTIAPWSISSESRAQDTAQIDTTFSKGGPNSLQINFQATDQLKVLAVQLLDTSTIVANSAYTFSAQFNPSSTDVQTGCSAAFFRCGYNGSQSAKEATIPFASKARDAQGWVSLGTTCTWTTAQKNAGGLVISVGVICAAPAGGLTTAHVDSVVFHN